MTGPVDVLFVMLRDAIHADAYRESHGMSLEDFRACNMDSRDAREAVDELIEAAQRIADNIIICDTQDGRAVCAALAHVRGAA